MNLDDAQKQQVIAWLQQGATLAQVQQRIETELGLRLTYREVKFLVSDLQVLPQDAAPAPSSVLAGPRPQPGSPAPPPAAPPPAAGWEPPAPPTSGPGRVQVAVDQLARPGAMVSGQVTFTDGKSAVWYIDQAGRIGIAPKEKGYRPPAADMQEFQMALDQELSRQGF